MFLSFSKRYSEYSTLIRFTFEFYISIVLFNNLLGKLQTDSCTRLVIVFSGSVETIENISLILFFNTYTVVLDINVYPVLIFLCTDTYSSVFGCVFKRIGDKVYEDSLQFFRIEEKQLCFFFKVNFIGYLTGICIAGEIYTDTLKEGVDIHFTRPQLCFSCLNLRQLHNLIDQSIQLLRIIEHYLEVCTTFSFFTQLGNHIF